MSHNGGCSMLLRFDCWSGFGVYFIFIFFFQAEDGIRDGTVTGVQTCALPIYRAFSGPRRASHYPRSCPRCHAHEDKGAFGGSGGIRRTRFAREIAVSARTSSLTKPYDQPGCDEPHGPARVRQHTVSAARHDRHSPRPGRPIQVELGATISPDAAADREAVIWTHPGDGCRYYNRRSETIWSANQVACRPVNQRSVWSYLVTSACPEGLPDRRVMTHNSPEDGTGRHRNSLLRVRRNERRCDDSPVHR